tara:strand:+ start:43 stop:600 length:558 start_codon:yes stop_codon:yes gene_type:complete
MLEPLPIDYKGFITISGPTKSGKSQLAEFLIKDQRSITYIATSKPRENDPEWEKRVNAHRIRRPYYWKLIEHPTDILKSLESLDENESILLDSLGGLVEHYLMVDDYKWLLLQDKIVSSIVSASFMIIVVAEELGWGIVPSTAIGNQFRERHSKLFSLLSMHSTKKFLAINGMAIDIDKIGFPIQ